MKINLGFLLLFFAIATCMNAQISIPVSGVVSENFNSMGSSTTASLPADWKMSAAGGGSSANWSTITNITAVTQGASSGSPTTGGAYNWATTAGTDRSPGFMTSGSYTSPNSILARYQNNTGSTINSLTVTFQIERYRTNTSAFTLSFSSSTDDVSWTPQTAGDISAAVFSAGTNAYHFGTPLTVYKSATINGLNISNGSFFYLRWVFTTPGNTNSQGLGLDNVTLSVNSTSPVVSATLTDALTLDNNNNNKANEGDKLTYTATVKNDGSNAANVQYNTTIDPNTTLTGTVKSSALANDDNYSTPLNTMLSGQNVIDNDFGLPAKTLLSFGPTENSSATVAAGTGSSDNGGVVMVNANGTFTYTPPTGFVGYDKFSYVVQAGVAPNDIGTVTIAVGAMPVAGTAESFPGVIGNVAVNNAPGLLSNDAGDVLKIAAVNGNPAGSFPINTTTASNANLTINADGTFIYNPRAGYEGADNFSYTIDNGFSSAQTVTVNITVAGMIWFINNTVGAGDGRLLSPFNSLAAFQALNNGGGAGLNPAANEFIFIYESATNYLGPIILLNGQKLIGQDATASLATITGYTVPSYSASLPVMNSGNGTITNLTTTAAATNVVNLTNGATSNLVRGLTIGDKTGTGISGTNFGTLTVNDAVITGTGQALGLATGTLSATFNSVSSSSGVNGISLTTVAGSLTVNGGSITGNSGTAFHVSGSNPTITYSGNITQNTSGQRVINIDGTTGNTITFNTGIITGGSNSTGINLNNVNGNVSFSNGLNLGTSGSRMTNQAITVSGGTGTYNLGALSVFTTGVQGLVTTNADGTINATGSVNASNATAINIDGPAGLTTLGFALTSVTSAGGTANGISLQDANGSFTVNGDGTNTSVGGNSSGGTISNKSGADGSTTSGNGIYMSNVTGVTLRRMTVNGTNQNHGIRGVNVTNFKLEYSTVSGSNGTSQALDEGSVNFDNLLGTTCAITNCNIDGGFEDNLNIVNTSGTLNRLVITGSTFGFNNTTNGNNNILISAQNAGTVLNFTIQSCLIKGARADWLSAINNSSSTMDAVIGGTGVGNTFDNLGANAHPGAAAGGNRLVVTSVGTHTVDIRSNILKGSKGEAIFVRATATGAITGNLTGYVRNNTVGIQGTANSGSSESSGIFVTGDGGSSMTVSVMDNSVFQYNNHGIRFDFGDEINDGSVFNISCTGNVVSTPGNINNDFNGVHLNNGTVGATDNFTTCFHLSGNTLTGSGKGLTPPNNQEFRLRQRQSTTVRLPGYGGTNNNDAAVVAFIRGQNTVSAGNGAASNTVPTGGGFVGGAACTVPGF